MMNDLWNSLQREAAVISKCLDADVRILISCKYDANSDSTKQEMRASEGSLHSMPTSTATAIAGQRSVNASNSTSYIRISNPEAQPPPNSLKKNAFGSVISYASGSFVNGVFVDEPQTNYSVTSCMLGKFVNGNFVCGDTDDCTYPTDANETAENVSIRDGRNDRRKF